jgi:histidinol dehydrogenase
MIHFESNYLTKQGLISMKVITYPSKSAEKRMSAIVGRGIDFKKKDIQNVTRILADVQKRGDDALMEYTHRFDAPRLKSADMMVSQKEMQQAVKAVGRPFVRALNRAVAQIEDFHKRQKQNSWIDMPRAGTILGQLINPVDRVGVYVPGGQSGKTPLVSSVLMNVIPARIAGVRKIIMVSPPKKNGRLDPHLLVAARKVKVDSIYKAGSAWAVAALAFGTQTIPKVDVIVGPGNIYVTLAKKMVSGMVGIDMIAGPSEILVIADKSARPAFIAADLLSQAEHDPLASSVLVTDSRETAKAVVAAVEEQLKNLKRKEIAIQSMSRFGAAFVVETISQAIDVANRLAPEHLELQIEKPFDYIGRIKNAGAVFIGKHTPEPVGDYIAGPNHVLPTAGTARFSSALSVDCFTKKTSLIRYTKGALEKEAKDILELASVEGLDAHANAVRIRLDGLKDN